MTSVVRGQLSVLDVGLFLSLTEHAEPQSLRVGLFSCNNLINRTPLRTLPAIGLARRGRRVFELERP
jgi:hypothetical protein